MAWRDREHRGNWSSSPNMWKDPKSITGKKKSGCGKVTLLIAIGGFSFVYAVTRLVIDWIA